MRTFLLGVVALVLAATAAVAQEPAIAVAVPETSWWYPIWGYIQPVATVFLTTFSTVAAGAAVAVLVQLARKFGVEVSDTDRKRYHEAAENALKAAIGRYVGPMPNMINGPVPPEILAEAERYLRDLNPKGSDKLSDKQLTDIILSKVPQVAAIIQAGKPGETTGTVEVATTASPNTA